MQIMEIVDLLKDFPNVQWTQGAILFYGGIAGMGIAAIAAVIAAVILGSSKLRITKKLDEEYGMGDN
ncbi:MAG: hypothetical protein FWH00_00210 [Oscillospiraceae bacterium]|nr:hypothetical protein [Oscillospiraceae bacterium]